MKWGGARERKNKNGRKIYLVFFGYCSHAVATNKKA